MRRKSRPNDAHPEWTEARFWQYVRGGLRELSVKWPPRYAVLDAARRKSQSKNKALKWEYACAECKGFYPRSEVSLDHKIGCGSLNTFEDLPGFTERLFCRAEGFQVLCRTCHTRKTAATKAAGKSINQNDKNEKD